MTEGTSRIERYLASLRRAVRASSDRRRSEAMAHVTHEAVLLIRTMSYKRAAMLDSYFPGTDHQEQIRLLADALDTLVPGIPDGSRRALQRTCRTRPQQRAWMADVLSRRGITLEDLL